jgi:hypothetical protein
MQYKSPIPLLQYAGVDTKDISVAGLNKIQKGLLIELDLSEEKTLCINGDDLTKDDILSIFDDLKDDKVMQYHQWIYDSPYLLKLIQYDEVSADDGFFDLSLSYHYNFSDFKTFVSPYLSQPLAKAINRAFLKRRFKEAQELMVVHYLISDPYFDVAFGKLRSSLKALADEIHQTEQNIRTFKRSRFTFITPPFIDFLNALPEQLTADRDAVVTGLINLSVKLQYVDFEFCYDLYQILKHAKCDAETQELLFHNLDVFSNKKNKKTTAFTGRFTVGMGIFVLMMILRACAG